MGASLGGYHAANTLFKYPDVVKRCFALSGVYDMKRFMDGVYDENFYFNNPVDYLANLSDPWALGNLATCDIHIATGTGPWEKPDEAYRLSGILASRGIRHHLDDWGAMGGHDWPYWKHQLREYLKNGRLTIEGLTIERLVIRQSSINYIPNFSITYFPPAITCSPSIHTSQSRVSTSMCVRDFQFAPVWLP